MTRDSILTNWTTPEGLFLNVMKPADLEMFGQIKETVITNKGNKVVVSTVADNYSRLWNFETIVFACIESFGHDDELGYVDHYITKEEAIKGHTTAIEYVKANY